MLYGRATEQGEIDRRVARLASGHGGLVLIRGETGIGKTALLEHAGTVGADLTALRCTGVESAAMLPFAGLHQLLRGHLGHLDGLPAEQATSLRRALGLAAPAGTEGSPIGLALLALFGAMSAVRPVLCLADDAQWLDRASADALAFAGRRLGDTDAVLLAIAVRDDEPVPATVLDLTTFGRDIRLAGLDPAAASALLADRAPTLDPPTHARVLDEARGNPLALLEISGAVVEGPGEPGSRVVPVALPRTGGRVEESLRTRIGRLPAASRTAMLVTAADDTGDLRVVLAAAERLGASVADVGAAERARLVATTSTSITVRHPLIRSVAYGDATVAERCAAHRALAAVLDVEEHADRRAWHLAEAALRPDPGTAAELAAAARRAHHRGGYAESAAAYERAASLTTDREQRGQLLAAAAARARDAGQLQRAAALAHRAGTLVEDAVAAAHLAEVRARNEFHGPVPARAAELAVAAAEAVLGEDPGLAAELVIEAIRFGHYAAWPDTIGRAARLVRDLSLPAGHPLEPLLAASAIVIRLRDGADPADLPSLAAAVRDIELDPLIRVPGPLGVHAAALHLLADDPQRALDASDRMASAARQRGLLGGLPHILLVQVEAAIALGQPADAVAIGTEALAVAAQSAQEHARTSICGALAHAAAWTGDEDRCREFAGLAAEHGRRCHADADTAMAVHALSLLDAGAGRAAAAVERCRSTPGYVLDHPVIIGLAAPEWIEAAARTGDTGPVLGLLARYESWSRRHQGPAARAVAHRCRALVSTGDAARAHFQAALRLHASTRRPLARARTELAYGEWLRRTRCPVQARTPLRAALAAFRSAGAVAWSGRARTELRAAGATLDPGTADPVLDSLSVRELQVARLAAAGRTNREIGVELFLSARTVGYHLHKCYTKLGITGRRGLAALGLADTPP